MTLRLARTISGILVQRLRQELHVQRRLHQCLQAVPLARGAESRDQAGAGLLKMVRQDLARERRGRAADLAVHENQGEEHVVDVGFRVRGAGVGTGLPGRRGDACVNEGVEVCNCGLDVRLEEACVDLGEDVANRLAFVGEFDGEEGLELGDEVRDCDVSKVREVGEAE